MLKVASKFLLPMSTFSHIVLLPMSTFSHIGGWLVVISKPQKIWGVFVFKTPLFSFLVLRCLHCCEMFSTLNVYWQWFFLNLVRVIILVSCVFWVKTKLICWKFREEMIKTVPSLNFGFSIFNFVGSTCTTCSNFTWMSIKIREKLQYYSAPLKFAM